MNINSKNIISNLLSRYPQLTNVKNDIESACEILIDSFESNGKLLVAGNGGSASDSLHIIGELAKSFVLPRTISEELKYKIGDDQLSESLQYGLPAISLVSETALFTAFSNDNNADAVFAQQVLTYAKPNDVLWLISTSGNSKNCVNAAKVAKALGIKIISLTGIKESKLSALSDVTIKAPECETYKVQELHLPIYHAICLVLENEFYGD